MHRIFRNSGAKLLIKCEIIQHFTFYFMLLLKTMGFCIVYAANEHYKIFLKRTSAGILTSSILSVFHLIPTKNLSSIATDINNLKSATTENGNYRDISCICPQIKPLNINMLGNGHIQDMSLQNKMKYILTHPPLCYSRFTAFPIVVADLQSA